MAKRTRFSEYENRYANYRFELTDDGILFMQCHTDGGSLVWDWQSHDDMSRRVRRHRRRPRDQGAHPHRDRRELQRRLGPAARRRAARDADLPRDARRRGLLKLDEKAWYARHLIFNVLDVDVPMISAVNGPCNIHSEVPLMGDIVLASEDAYFQDASHFPRGRCPATAST